MPDNFDLFAAELAFGLLDGSELGEAESLRSTDRGFAAAVAKWQAIAEAWLTELPDYPPSPELWDRIPTLIGQSRDVIEVVAAPLAVAIPGPGLWRPLALAASLAACLFAGLWASRLGTSAPSSPPNDVGRFSVAQIGGAGERQLATVLYDRAAGTLTIRIAAIVPNADTAPELWLIDGTNPPHSLGFGRAGAATRIQPNARWQRSLVGGATVAITLEPVSDRPHTAPSTRILGTGTISTL